MNTISKFDDVIDSRDVIARIDELKDELETLKNEAENDANEEQGKALAALHAWQEENSAELTALMALADEAGGYAADWEYGETLIRDSYFKEYAMELAEGIGAIPSDAKWPCTCIDWDQAAKELQMDYTAVDFDGVTYWVR